MEAHLQSALLNFVDFCRIQINLLVDVKIPTHTYICIYMHIQMSVKISFREPLKATTFSVLSIRLLSLGAVSEWSRPPKHNCTHFVLLSVRLLEEKLCVSGSASHCFSHLVSVGVGLLGLHTPTPDTYMSETLIISWWRSWHFAFRSRISSDVVMQTFLLLVLLVSILLFLNNFWLLITVVERKLYTKRYNSFGLCLLSNISQKCKSLFTEFLIMTMSLLLCFGITRSLVKVINCPEITLNKRHKSTLLTWFSGFWFF